MKTYTKEQVTELCTKAFNDAREFHSQDGLIDIDQCVDLPRDLSPNTFDSYSWINNNLI